MTAPPLIAIVGPTGIGKTTLAIQLARHFGGEIISADSRQIYHHMDIGTAKPTPAEQAAARHHLIDLVPPDYRFTLAEFQRRAMTLIDQLHARNMLPLLVGGTGQWVWSVLEGWGIPRVPPDAALRARLEAEAELLGGAALHERLQHIDADAAARIDPRNLRRVIRALEVYEKTGVPISVHQQKTPPPYRMVVLGLTMPREVLYERIDERIDGMMDAGLLAEVEALHAAGYDWQLPSMSGLGYRQLGFCLRGEMALAEAVALIKRDTRRFIRQQYNWFGPSDPRITWFDVSLPDLAGRVIDHLTPFLAQT